MKRQTDFYTILCDKSIRSRENLNSLNLCATALFIAKCTKRAILENVFNSLTNGHILKNKVWNDSSPQDL